MNTIITKIENSLQYKKIVTDEYCDRMSAANKAYDDAIKLWEESIPDIDEIIQPQVDEIVNEFYSKILYQWLPSANLVKNDSIPIVEVYPRDMSKDGFEWEIWLPIFK